MRNLRADVAELFAALSGAERLQEALERWRHRSLARHREYERERRRRRTEVQREKLRTYSREYAARRYKTDPGFRSRHLEAVHRYKDRKLGADRARVLIGPVAIVHGTYLAYTKRGCRCTPCRAASAAYQRNRRAKMKSA